MAEECHTPKRSRISLGSDLRILVAFRKGKHQTNAGVSDVSEGMGCCITMVASTWIPTFWW